MKKLEKQLLQDLLDFSNVEKETLGMEIKVPWGFWDKEGKKDKIEQSYITIFKKDKMLGITIACADMPIEYNKIIYDDKGYKQSIRIEVPFQNLVEILHLYIKELKPKHFIYRNISDLNDGYYSIMKSLSEQLK